MSERTCLFCGISETEVKAVRNREGYTLGCGIESNTENGFDYDELSPQHRWKPWGDKNLAVMGIKPSAYDKYRTAIAQDIGFAACEDTIRGHNFAVADDAEFYIKEGQCWSCWEFGKVAMKHV